MTNITTGRATMPLAKPDASGNLGYSLSYDYKYQKENPEATIEYTNMEFSGPGSWDDYSEGEDYPFDQMLKIIMSKLINT